MLTGILFFAALWIALDHMFDYGLKTFVTKTLLGLDPNSDEGSNGRRFTIRIFLIWSLVYIAIALMSHADQTDYSTPLSIAAVTLTTAGLIVFVQIVLLMPFRASDSFKIDTRRLMADTIVSSIFNICAFSLIYLNLGLVGNSGHEHVSAYEALYFSAVTFSTLGYGDFAPTYSAKIIAAFQALIGNLHLGMLVGSTFATLNRKSG